MLLPVFAQNWYFVLQKTGGIDSQSRSLAVNHLHAIRHRRERKRCYDPRPPRHCQPPALDGILE
jgi:hypothetical protein